MDQDFDPNLGANGGAFAGINRQVPSRMSTMAAYASKGFTSRRRLGKLIRFVDRTKVDWILKYRGQ